MKTERLLQFAQELESLSFDASFYAQKRDAWAADALLEKQRELLATVDKVERELKGAVRFNLTALVGIAFPLESTLDSIAELLAGVEEIRESAVSGAEDLSPKVHQFTRLVEDYVSASVPLAA